MKSSDSAGVWQTDGTRGEEARGLERGPVAVCRR